MRQTMRERGPAMGLARGRGARAAALGAAPASGVTALVPLDTIQWDPLGCYLASISGFVVPITGFYDISASLGFPANATGARNLSILAGGYQQTVSVQAAPATDLTVLSASLTDLLLTAGQSIVMNAYQSSGVALNIQANVVYNWLAWELVRAL